MQNRLTVRAGLDLAELRRPHQGGTAPGALDDDQPGRRQPAFHHEEGELLVLLGPVLSVYEKKRAKG